MSSPGIGSGLDVKAIAEQLALAEVTPAKNRLDKMQSSFVAKLSSLGMIKSALGKLQSFMEKLSNLQELYAMKTVVSDPTILTAQVDSSAIPGNYQIQVMNLASQQTLASSSFTSPATVVGNGSLTISFGAYSSDLSTFTPNPEAAAVTITIAPGQDSLQAIQNSINNSGAGIVASIVQDSSGARLVLASPQTGQNYAMKISSASPSLAGLTYDPTTGNTSHLQQTAAATDSQIQFNGLTLSQSNNDYDNIISGISVNLLKASPGNTINLAIENNKTQLNGLIHDFVAQYNEAMSTLNNLTGYDPLTKSAGPMQGDSDIRAIKFALSGLITQAYNSPGSPLQSLSDIGIKTSISRSTMGFLSIDEPTLSNAMENNYQYIGSLFAKSAVASDPEIRVNSLSSRVDAGVYDVLLDTYVPGVSMSGSINGVPASSTDGYTLQGSGDLRDLYLDVTGGSTGSRGKITVTDGAAVQLNTFLSSVLDKNSNLSSRSKQLDERIDETGFKREKLADRAEALRDRYFKQFSRLDQLMASMLSISSFLTQELARLPDFNRK